MSNLRQSYQAKFYERPLAHQVIKSTVREILSIAENKLGKKPDQLIILDVGSGRGEYSQEFAKFVKKVVGIEPYFDAYQVAQKSPRYLNKTTYHNLLIEEFKTNEKFDVVVCLTTLEHMPNALKSFRKIYKLMKKESIMYLTAPNKLWPYENHYHLFFLSWLPLPLANIYMRIAGRGQSYDDSSYSMTYFGLRSFLKKFNWDFEFFVPDVNAAYLGCGRGNLTYNIIKSLGVSLIRRLPFLWVISKGFIVIVRKK